MNLARHFLLLNVIALALGWMLTNDFPEKVYVSAETEPGLVIQTDCRRGCRFEGSETRRFWLPDGFFTGDLVLHRGEGSADARITDVRVWSRLVFEHRWNNAADLAFDENGTIALKASAASFGLSRIGWFALVGGEIGLLLLAGAFALLARFARPRSARDPRAQIDSQRARESRALRFGAVIVALAVAVFCGGIVPLQTLLANQAELGLSVGPVLLALSWRVLLLAIILVAMLSWSTRFAGALYLLLASAFLVYEYLETGVLSIGSPVITGDMRFYWNSARMVWDALVFPVVFLILIVLCRFIPRSLALIPCTVFVLGLSSLWDVRSPPSERLSDFNAEFKPKNAVVRESVYSKTRNVLVYVLDSAATPFLRELFRQNPSFRESFTGFTWYANNLGMYGYTVMAVAGMLTGRYCENASKEVEYMHSAYSKDSLLADFLDGKSAVFFCHGGSSEGVSTGGGSEKIGSACAKATADKRENRWTADNSNSGCGVLDTRMDGELSWTLPEIVRFRLLPFGLKNLAFVCTKCGWPYSRSADNETWTYPILSEAPLADTPLALHWIHTNGMHPPFGITRQGVDDGLVRESDAAKVDKLWFAWSQLVGLLNRLKARGIYESSMIVITADHGWDMESDKDRRGDRAHLPASAWPILLVKPPAAAGPLRESALPTSHVRIRDLVLRARSEWLTAADVDSILRCDGRYYSLPQPGRRGFSNIYADAAQRTTVRFQPSVGEGPLAQAITLDHHYSLCGDNWRDPPPVWISKARHWGMGEPLGLWPGSEGADLRFKGPGKGIYRVKLDIRVDSAAEIKDLHSSNRLAITDPVRRVVTVDLVSDDTGMVSAVFLCPENATLCLYSIKVSRR